MRKPGIPLTLFVITTVALCGCASHAPQTTSSTTTTSQQTTVTQPAATRTTTTTTSMGAYH